MRLRFFRSALVTACALAFAVLFVLFAPLPLHAQDSAPAAATTNAVLETAGAVAQPFIVSFAQEYPWLLTTLALIATLRLVFKPIVSALEAWVRSTPSTEDDATFERVTHARWFKVAAWLLDYLGSIKVGPQFTAKPAAPQESHA